jgi:glycerate dehydrogenase
MKIIVTDGYTLNGGDLSWEGLSRFGQLDIYERTPLTGIVERCKEADVIVTNKTPFSRETLSALANVKCIAVTATGYNIIDTKAAAEKGIVV